MELGEQKPSLLLNRMIQMASGVMDDEKVVKSLWMQKLHPTVRGILTAFPENSTIDSLACHADSITESMQISGVNAIETPSQQKPNAIAELSRQFEALATEVRHMRDKKRFRSLHWFSW